MQSQSRTVEMLLVHLDTGRVHWQIFNSPGAATGVAADVVADGVVTGVAADVVADGLN